METLKEYIARHTANEEKSSCFAKYIEDLKNAHGIKKDSEIYNKANISRQNWSSFMSNKSEPSLKTLLKVVFAMKLTNHECKYLLKKMGFTLSSSSKFSLIIRYCVENKIYDLYDVNRLLEENGFSDSLLI